MLYFLSLLAGALVSLAIVFNGGLSQHYGLYLATVIIHVVGLIFIAVLVFIKKNKIRHKMQPWYFYIGGFLGVIIVLFTNAAFSRISVSAILALGLLGQCIGGIIFDQYGLLGMPKTPFTKKKLFGITLIIMGIVPMINSFEIIAVLISFGAGLLVLVARTLNANLSEVTSVQTSTFYNYVIGLIGAIVALLLLGRGDIGSFSFDLSVSANHWHLYLGGVVGVVFVSIVNFSVKKITAFYLTLLMFTGQIFTGIILDVILTGEFAMRNLIGGTLVALGLCVDLILDSKQVKNTNKAKDAK